MGVFLCVWVCCGGGLFDCVVFCIMCWCVWLFVWVYGLLV